jgi:hypothetical protein
VVNDKGEYTTQSITFEGKQQIGTADPQNYTPTKFEIYVDGVLTETLTDVSQVTCTLGDDKYKVSSSLTCKMYLNEVVIDTQTAEVVHDGASLSKMEVLNWYFATDASSGVTIDTEGWTLEIANAQITESKRYLWNYESITSYKEDGSVISTTQSEPSIIGVYGQTGPTGVSISSIKDFYGVSASKTEIPAVWYNSQEQSDGAMPEPTPETPYLWTYEKFVYSDGTVVESSKRIISELSISIKAIKDWFMATATEGEKPAAPTEFAEDGTPTGWTTLDACGHGEDKPYLWTVEILDYNYGKDKQVTEVTLVTRVARSIKDFHEYYCITTTPTAPAAITAGTDGNLITLPENAAWVLADDNYVPTIEQGEWLWNQEVVEYTTKDNDGKNKYSTTSVQLMGYIGTSPYLINLTSDFATIPYDYDGATDTTNVNTAVFDTIDFTFQVFNGAKELKLGEDYVLIPTINGALDTKETKPQVLIKTNQATATVDAQGKVDIAYDSNVYNAAWARGTIVVEVYLDAVKMASATYELARQSGGADGSYEYLVTDPVFIKKKVDENFNISYEPTSIAITLMRRIGSHEPTISPNTRYADIYVDDLLIKNKQVFTNETISVPSNDLNLTGDLIKEIRVEVYTTADGSQLIDRETIPIVADGENAVREYLEVSPKRVVGKYVDGVLTYTPSTISVQAYRTVGLGDPIKLTDRYYKVFLDTNTDESKNPIVNDGNFAVSGAINTITVRAYSDAECTQETANESISVVADSVSIKQILKRWLTTNKESGITKDNILADEGGTNEVAGWVKSEEGAPVPVNSTLPYLWAYDKIEYTDGSYQTTAPIRLTSSASYTLSLSNDADVVAISNQTNSYIGELPTVIVSRWVGDLSKDTESLGVVECRAPSGWTKDTNYTFGVVDGYYTLIITSIPTGFFKGNFTFIWKETDSSTTSYASKTFSLTAVASLVDYEFQFDQTVFNSSRESGSYTFKVLKKDNTGTTQLAASNTEVGVYLNGSPSKLTSWAGSYGLDETAKRTYVLKDSAGMVWDTEVVEFVNDGEIEEIVTNETQITATYDSSGNLIYTPSSLTVEVHRIVG